MLRGWSMIMMEWFQSTPDLINRENKEKLQKQRVNLQFQSTPDLINRENNTYW